jgi:predicted alpha-1,6-mannanase (GH76 family)
MGWWNSANAITVLADYSRIADSKQYDGVFASTFTAAQRKNPGFLNKFYDDEGWWALAWIDVYDQTGNARYLGIAESIFTDMAGGWSDTCGGGIWWSKDRKYKNAIANELFLSVAAHLANRTADASRREYLNWANKEWAWFRVSGMINSSHLINDGLDNRGSETTATACTNNGGTVWSYNQGVILGGLTSCPRQIRIHRCCGGLRRSPRQPPPGWPIATAFCMILVSLAAVRMACNSRAFSFAIWLRSTKCIREQRTKFSRTTMRTRSGRMREE